MGFVNLQAELAGSRMRVPTFSGIAMRMPRGGFFGDDWTFLIKSSGINEFVTLESMLAAKLLG